MKTKHTPGHWRIGNDGIGPSIEGNSGELLAYICNEDDKCNVPIDAYSNARLITAAPELLEALLELYAVSDRYLAKSWDAMTKARAAISKATA